MRLSLKFVLLHSSLPLLNAATINLRNGYTGVATRLADSISSPILAGRGSAGLIESIAVNPATKDIYVQQQVFFGCPSNSTNIFKLETSNGVVSPVCLDTGFGICAKGSDLIFDENTGLLIAQDANANRIATVDPSQPDPNECAYGTWATFDSDGATFGGAISPGPPASDVPQGDLVFTAGVGKAGIESASNTEGPSISRIDSTSIRGNGDDMCIQSDGSWVHVTEVLGTLDKYNSTAPYSPVAGQNPGVNWKAVAGNESLFAGFGTRATCCPGIDSFVYTATSSGGAWIMKADPDLQSAEIIAVLDEGTEMQSEIKDLVVAPSSSGDGGNSIYFTVQDADGATGFINNEIWELTTPECVSPKDKPSKKHKPRQKPGRHGSPKNKPSKNIKPSQTPGRQGWWMKRGRGGN